MYILTEKEKKQNRLVGNLNKKKTTLTTHSKIITITNKKKIINKFNKHFSLQIP